MGGESTAFSLTHIRNPPSSLQSTSSTLMALTCPRPTFSVSANQGQTVEIPPVAKHHHPKTVATPAPDVRRRAHNGTPRRVRPQYGPADQSFHVNSLALPRSPCRPRPKSSFVARCPKAQTTSHPRKIAHNHTTPLFPAPQVPANRVRWRDPQLGTHICRLTQLLSNVNLTRHLPVPKRAGGR